MQFMLNDNLDVNLQILYIQCLSTFEYAKIQKIDKSKAGNYEVHVSSIVQIID